MFTGVPAYRDRAKKYRDFKLLNIWIEATIAVEAVAKPTTIFAAVAVQLSSELKKINAKVNPKYVMSFISSTKHSFDNSSGIVTL